MKSLQITWAVTGIETITVDDPACVMQIWALRPKINSITIWRQRVTFQGTRFHAYCRKMFKMLHSNL